MKVIVERDAFADAVGSAKHVVDRSLKIPILANALLRVNAASLEIAATNLDVRTECAVPADVVERGSVAAITVPIALLSDLASRVSKGAQLTLEWDNDSKSVSLSAGRARYKLHAMPATDFPVLPYPDDPVTFSLPGKELAAALNTTRWATFNGEGRPYLAGVYLHLTDDHHVALGDSKSKRLAFVATDGGHLARTAVDVPAGTKALPTITIPNMALGEIARIANDADGSVVFAVSPARLSASNGKTKFLTKLLDTTFPDYYLAIPTIEDARMLVDIDALRNALLRLKALAEDRRLMADITSGQIKLSLSADKGQAEEIIEVEFESEDLSLSFNSSDILSIIEHMQADTCLFRFHRTAPQQKKSAIIINPMKGTGIDYANTFLSMPMER